MGRKKIEVVEIPVKGTTRKLKVDPEDAWMFKGAKVFAHKYESMTGTVDNPKVIVGKVCRNVSRLLIQFHLGPEKAKKTRFVPLDGDVYNITRSNSDLLKNL